MVQQDKELLIKDLCARLPYGVRGRDNEFDYEYESNVVIGITAAVDADDYLVHYEDTTPGYLYADGFKPILFPLSAINQEIEVNGKRIFPYIELNLSEIDSNGDILTLGDERISVFAYTEVVNLFLMYHIDYRNLVEKGLAISVFDLPENPYK